MSNRGLASLRPFWEQLGRHGAVYFVAEGIAKGGTYLLLVWLATLMAVEDFGLLNVFISYVTLFGVIVGVGLPEALVRWRFSETDFRPVLTLSMLLPVVIGMSLMLMVLPGRVAAAAALNIPSGLLISALLGGILVAHRQAVLALLRAHRDVHQYLQVRILEPGLFLATIAVLLLTRDPVGYETVVAAFLITIGGVGVVGLVGGVQRVGFRWSLAPLRRLLRFSLPLVGHGLAMAGLALFDQLVLQQVLGSEPTGVYAFAYRFGMAMALVVFGFSAAWGPLSIERLGKGEGATLGPLGGTAFRVLLVVGVLLAWGMPPLAEWLGGARYHSSLRLIPLIVYAYVWVGLYGLAATHLYFANRSGTLAAVSLTAFLLNALLNYATVPHWGEVAAATTTVISYMVLAGLAWAAVGEPSGGLPWRRWALHAFLAAPVFLGATAFFT